MTLELPLLLSGPDERTLRALAGNWAEWLAADASRYRWVDLAYSAAIAGPHFAVRASILAANVREVVMALRALAAGDGHAAITQGVAKRRSGLVFVFPGQGSQWERMGADLLEQSPEFAWTVDACDEALRPFTGWSVRDVLAGKIPEGLTLDQTDVAQPALFTFGVALDAAWRSLGVRAAAVLGLSIGEIEAAVACGALSIADGCRIMAVRSRAVRALRGKGGMLLVERGVGDLQPMLDRYAGAVTVAAINTARSTVLSGALAPLGEIEREGQSRGWFCRRVNIDYASHGPQIDPLLGDLETQLEGISPGPGEVPFYSTMMGNRLDCELLTGRYWCQSERRQVRAGRALESLKEAGYNVFLEVSAHPVQAMTLADGCADIDGVVVGSLRRGAGDLSRLYETLGYLHVHGCDVDWTAAYAPLHGRIVELPEAVRPSAIVVPEVAGGFRLLREELLELSAAQRRRQLVRIVCQEAAIVLGLQADERQALGGEQVLKELGLSSLGAVTLSKRLSVRLDVVMPPTIAFECPTLAAIADWLHARIARETIGTPAPDSAPSAEPSSGHAGEPIAIVAMACRLPGGIDTPEAFSRVLAEGRDVIEPFPERWSTSEIYDPDPDAAGKSCARHGGFLRDLENFDAPFFGIAPIEARAMCPQQRLLLEVAWEVLERAGVTPGELRSR